jgi:hypothetical protein
VVFRAGTTESAVAVVALEEERICHDARWVSSVGGAGAGLGMGEGVAAALSSTL